MVDVEDQSIGESAVIEALVSPPKLLVDVEMYPGLVNRSPRCSCCIHGAVPERDAMTLEIVVVV